MSSIFRKYRYWRKGIIDYQAKHITRIFGAAAPEPFRRIIQLNFKLHQKFDPLYPRDSNITQPRPRSKPLLITPANTSDKE